MSTINAGTTLTTGLALTSDTTGNVVIQANSTSILTVNSAGIILNSGVIRYPDGTTSNTAASAVSGALNVTIQQSYGGF